MSGRRDQVRRPLAGGTFLRNERTRRPGGPDSNPQCKRRRVGLTPGGTTPACVTPGAPVVVERANSTEALLAQCLRFSAPPTPLAASRATACAPTPSPWHSWASVPSPSCTRSSPLLRPPSRRPPRGCAARSRHQQHAPDEVSASGVEPPHRTMMTWLRGGSRPGQARIGHRAPPICERPGAPYRQYFSPSHCAVRL